MLIHALIFSKPGSVSQVTKVDMALLRESAAILGHTLKTIYARECQVKFDKKPDILIEKHKPEDIKVLIVRANFLKDNLNLKGSTIKQFELAGIPVVNNSLSVRRSKNKLMTMQALSKKNVPVPKTYIVSHSDYIDQVMKDIGSFPVILKTITGSHGGGVSIIESKRALRSVVEMFIKDGSSDPLMIQEYVKESQGKDIRVFIVGKRIVGAMERIAGKKGEFRSNFHLGGRVRVASMSAKEKKVSFDAAAACGLEIAGVDLLRTKTGPKILEVNANPGLEGITKAIQRDIAGEIIKYAVKKAKRLKRNGKAKETRKKTKKSKTKK